jgi:hypothetical protein
LLKFVLKVSCQAKKIFKYSFLTIEYNSDTLERAEMDITLRVPFGSTTWIRVEFIDGPNSDSRFTAIVSELFIPIFPPFPTKGLLDCAEILLESILLILSLLSGLKVSFGIWVIFTSASS